MKIRDTLVNFSLEAPKKALFLTLAFCIGLGLLIPQINIDTDPENMLPEDQPARVFHNVVKKDFALYDMLIIGVVNEKDPAGVFNPASLANIHALSGRIAQMDGVIRQDLLSLSTVDDISQDGPGVVRFEWLMKAPPKTAEAALAIRAAADRNPTLRGTLISENGKATAIYVPITHKNESHRIAEEIKKITAGFSGTEQYYITGLPVAEETFGIEMFKQMGIAAPLAGLLVFILLWVFFRSFALIASPMALAMITVISTMGLLIGMGFTVHIMSSMIPIFLMPIAVVDSVHILSEFFDHYPAIGDRKKTIRKVMGDLFTPMLYTSLTSAVGFASLAFAPIPPVQVFGMFIAFGILLAFFLTVTFLPAYIMLLSDKSIRNFEQKAKAAEKETFLSRLLKNAGSSVLPRSKWIISLATAVLGISIYGISQIQINDNPVRWFNASHPIRVADRVLNTHFGGAYNAYLVLKSAEEKGAPQLDTDQFNNLLAEIKADSDVDLSAAGQEMIAAASPSPTQLDDLIEAVLDKLVEVDESEILAWERVLAFLETAQSGGKFFQSPEALRYIEAMQQNLLTSGLVGKSNSLADIVKTVHRELREGNAQYFTIPESNNGVAQTLLSYQSSHRPHDLWHFAKPDFSAANIWLQLKSGDNQDMLAVVDHLNAFLEKSPPPAGISVDWAGLTYLNVVWQQNMVAGMLNALLGSFVIVFIMMLILFRSFWFGLLAMLPLTITITFIYGFIGLIGKDYDMPIAVLSSLTLGLSVDFAIHFLQRLRVIYSEIGDWRKTVAMMFKEPARAISRNAIVIAIGFLPLLASPLIPYNTVGFFLATIMSVSCIATLLLLPAVINQGKKFILRERHSAEKLEKK